MKDIQVKVNVINQLKLFKFSTFKDRLCFLDEDIQNAQRAKAKNFKVTIESSENKLIIENDGEVLKDPQCLFSIAESGWDNDVKQNENPFGMGFFSNIAVSDDIEIYSGYDKILFNVNEMISNNDPNLKVEKSNKFYNGFKLVLNKFNFDDIYSFQIKERVELLGEYIQSLDVYYNGRKIDNKDLTEDDGSTFTMKIEEKDYCGWIGLGDNYYWEDEFRIFYKGRYIKSLPMNKVKGCIHINDKVLNLTAPDRKDIIKDSKLNNFENEIRIYAKLLAEESFINGEDEDIERHIHSINYYIDKKSIIDKTKFAMFSNDDALEYIENIALAKKEDDNIKSFKDYKLYLDKNKSKNNFKELVVEEKVVTKAPDAKGIVTHSSSSSYSEGYTDIPSIDEEKLSEVYGNYVINKDEPTFWMAFDEIIKYEKKFNMIKHYNLKLIVARNKIEKDLLTDLKEEYNVTHISDLNEDIRVIGNLSNTDLNIKEQRAMMLLDMISRILSKDHNIFSIGDLIAMKHIKIESIDLKNEVIEDSVVVLRDDINDKVYIDRSIIDKSDLQKSLSEELTLCDYKFILTNIHDICEASCILTNMSYGEVKDLVIKALGQGEIN